MGRLSLLGLTTILASGCWLSHTIDDGGMPRDGGPDTGPFMRPDLGPRDLGPDLGPPRCVPGETQSVPCGHCGTSRRSCGPESVWGTPGTCTGETETCGVDIMFLADVTGSHTSFFTASEATITTDLVVPLEADADVRVGIAAFADYPYGGYGSPPDDRPFIGVLPPTHDVGAVDTAISTIMFLGGDDGPEGEIEGLNDLSGGIPHPSAMPFVCMAGEVPGGCWRPTVLWRVIIVMTDVASHSLPDGNGGLVDPYNPSLFVAPDGTPLPPPPDWTTVRANLVATSTYVYWIVPENGVDTAGITGAMQARELARQLGEDPAEAVATYADGSPDASFPVRIVRDTMAAHFGIHLGP